uniref:SPRY domain-containing protein n=1 Tax=Meloidogyne hapla TaxID=6305 RepID=A0A1I8BLW4_MELHA
MKYAHGEFGLSKWIYYGKEERRKYVEFPRYEDVFNNNDIYGCGLVFPPTNKSEKSPYIFFTKNGKKVDRTYFGDYDGFEPFIRLGCCSVEANFGTKPFIYDVNNHYALKQYSDKDYTVEI